MPQLLAAALRSDSASTTATAAGSSHHAFTPSCVEQRGQRERDRDACGDAPVVADDEVPPEAAERAEIPHASAPAVTRTVRRRRSARTSTSETTPKNAITASSESSSPGQSTPAPSAPQKQPKLVSSSPTANLIVFSGTRESGPLREDPGDDDDDERGRCAGDREPEVALRAAERDHDEDDLEPLEQHALERDGERVPVEAETSFVPGRRGLLALLAERLVLVVQILEAARAEDRLAQPLQSEREQQRADDEAERVDRDRAERRPERGDEQREHDSGRAGADQRRAPAADDADAEHDRQRLDHLDGAREERAGDDQDRARAHGSGTSLSREPRASKDAIAVEDERRLPAVGKLVADDERGAGVVCRHDAEAFGEAVPEIVPAFAGAGGVRAAARRRS